MKKILLLALIVGVVFLYGCKEDALQEPEIVVTANSLSLDPAFSKAAVGDEFVLSVMAKDVSPIAGWQFSLSYDPEVLEAKGVSEGDFLKGADGRTYWVAPKMNPGSIENAAAPLLSGGMRDGSGVVQRSSLLRRLLDRRI